MANETRTSLSVILPVHNAEKTLSGSVSKLLDIVSEMSSAFEVVIVDDGSDDQTEDVARELARSYPQVRVAHQREHSGVEEAARTGLELATGEVVIVNSGMTIDAGRIRQMWELRGQEDVVAAQSGTAPGVVSEDLLERLAAWGAGLEEAEAERVDEAGVQMIRRRSRRAPIHMPTSPTSTPTPTW